MPNLDTLIEQLGKLIGELIEYRNILKMSGQSVEYIESLTKDMRSIRNSMMKINKRGGNGAG